MSTDRIPACGRAGTTTGVRVSGEKSASTTLISKAINQANAHALYLLSEMVNLF